MPLVQGQGLLDLGKEGAAYDKALGQQSPAFRNGGRCSHENLKPEDMRRSRGGGARAGGQLQTQPKLPSPAAHPLL